MVEIERLANTLQWRSGWQKTPETLYLEDYCALVYDALRQLFVMTGRAALFDEAKTEYEDDMPIRYSADILADEYEWLMVTAQIGFFRRVQQDVNTLTGYSTDALTVSNADKPYANLQATLRDLENQQRTLYYKMTRFNLL